MDSVGRVRFEDAGPVEVLVNVLDTDIKATVFWWCFFGAQNALNIHDS